MAFHNFLLISLSYDRRTHGCNSWALPIKTCTHRGAQDHGLMRFLFFGSPEGSARATRAAISVRSIGGLVALTWNAVIISRAFCFPSTCSLRPRACFGGVIFVLGVMAARLWIMAVTFLVFQRNVQNGHRGKPRSTCADDEANHRHRVAIECERSPRRRTAELSWRPSALFSASRYLEE